MGWKVTFGCGPAGLHKVPHELREGMLSKFTGPVVAGLCGFQITASSNFGDAEEQQVIHLLATEDDVPDTASLRGAGQACDALSSFLETLQEDNHENFDKFTLAFGLTGRRPADEVPEVEVLEVPTLVEGLRLVTEAIDQIISRRGARGGCDWAMLCCERQR
jgi:hypothetical protein